MRTYTPYCFTAVLGMKHDCLGFLRDLNFMLKGSPVWAAFHFSVFVLFDEQRDEFCSKSRKTVSVGNHNCELFSDEHPSFSAALFR